MTSMTTKEAKTAAAAVGAILTKTDGEYRVVLKGGTEASAYYTNDVDDAVATARAMAKRANGDEPIASLLAQRQIRELLRTIATKAPRSAEIPRAQNRFLRTIEKAGLASCAGDYVWRLTDLGRTKLPPSATEYWGVFQSIAHDLAAASREAGVDYIHVDDAADAISHHMRDSHGFFFEDAKIALTERANRKRIYF
jgi:hypothetical protein